MAMPLYRPHAPALAATYAKLENHALSRPEWTADDQTLMLPMISSDASYTGDTGANYSIDGGWTAHAGLPAEDLPRTG